MGDSVSKLYDRLSRRNAFEAKHLSHTGRHLGSRQSHLNKDNRCPRHRWRIYVLPRTNRPNCNEDILPDRDRRTCRICAVYLDGAKILVLEGACSATTSLADDARQPDNPSVSSEVGKPRTRRGQGKAGAYIRVAANTTVNEPVHIINLISSSENFLANTRNLIIVEKGAKLDVIETFVSLDSNANEKLFTNHLSEIVVEENAQVNYCRIQTEESNASQVNTTQVQQSKGSLFNTYTYSLSGEFLRNNLNIVLADENCETHLFGLYLPRKKEHFDNHTLVDHRMPNCFSNELYKGIMSDDATGVFNGKIFVRQDAQKTNAYQSNKNMLLGDNASVNTKPQLEIYADDVKCSHGTSTGRMDEEAMFYLRSRGIGEDKAKNLLMKAFAEEVVNAIQFAPLKEYIESLIANRFA